MQLCGAVTGSHSRPWRDVMWADSRRQGQWSTSLLSIYIHLHFHMSIGLWSWKTDKSDMVCIDCIYSSVFFSWILFFSTCICSWYHLSLVLWLHAIRKGIEWCFLKIWLQKKRSCHSAPNGRWNNVLYERGCLLKIITCDIYGSGQICACVWFSLRLDFNVLFDFDCTRLILNEQRSGPFCFGRTQFNYC